MSNHSMKDESARNVHAVCFAEVLAKELLEVDALRKDRAIIHDNHSRDAAAWELMEEIAKNAGATDRKDKKGEAAAMEATAVVGQARQMDLVGLAFSGGGIRSATFNLGVLQGLAQYSKVRIFDYLSTVSGGGYIGSWLAAWILRSGQDEQHRAKQRTAEPKTEARKGIDLVEEDLRPTRTERQQSVAQREWADQKSHTEPPPIRFLRDYGNYLTPRLGALGADTWTVLAIYLRNLLLNQAILVLFLFVLLLLPYIAFWLTGRVGRAWVWIAPTLFFTLLTWAVTVGARNLKWLTDCGQRPVRTKTWLPPQEQAWVLAIIVAPMLVALWVLTEWLWLHTGTWDMLPVYRWALAGTVLLGIPLSIGSIAAPRQSIAIDASSPLSKKTLALFRKYKMAWLREPKLFWFCESLATGAASGLLMWIVVHEAFAPLKGTVGAGWQELSIGVPLTLLVFLGAATILVGLMGRSFCDPYREWWARVAGWILISTIVWSAGFGIAIYAPLGLLWLRRWQGTTAILSWIGSTLTGVLGGNNKKTGDIEEGGVKIKLLSFTPYIFIVGLLSLLSLSLELILARICWAEASVQTAWVNFLAGSPSVGKVANWVLKVTGSATSGTLTLGGTATAPLSAAATAPPLYITAHFTLISTAAAHGWLIPLCAGVLGFCILLSCRVDLNEFSLSLMYRNRLVRCYLGASREMRDPNPFSGLDCDDDLFLSSMRSSHDYSGPLPILNGTLNLVSTRDLAWQQRKAESFPMTPLHCGFDTWIEQRNLERNFAHDKQMGKADQIAKYGYRPTDRYAYVDNGFYLGTAVSISGAAACPNMGYHSVPSLALLMTFFNVRLGFWAGNPRNNQTWTTPGPRVGLGQLLSELFGLTNDNADYVYLSDGGHFENLGIYELVKRRCKYIVAVDAGEDPDYSFEDLGNAIRKCREDIGVEIEIDTTPLVPKGASKGAGSDGNSDDGKKLSAQHCVIGTIHYEMADPAGEKGVFVYLKSSLTGDEPADVLNYQSAHSAFPHESTADQWFSESQFESYRRLGQHVVDSLFAGNKGTAQYEDLTLGSSIKALRRMPIDDLFAALAKKWQSVPAQKG